MRLNEKPIRWSMNSVDESGFVSQNLHSHDYHLAEIFRPVLHSAPLSPFRLNLAGAAPEANKIRPTSVARPNIILILADDLGYGDLGCYGQQRIQTPNLNKLAAEGIRFSTSCYAGSAVCSPHGALMLSQHTGHLNIRGNVRPTTLLPNEVTVAQVLKIPAIAPA